MELLMRESHMYLQDIKSSPLTYWPEQEQKYVFYQVEFVDKNNFEAWNPRRDTSIPSVSEVCPVLAPTLCKIHHIANPNFKLL